MIIVLSILAAALLTVFVIAAGCFMIAERRGKSCDLADRSQLRGTRWEKYEDKIENGIKWLDDMGGEVVGILSRDGLKLFGRYISNGKSKKTAILFHGYRSAAHNDFSCLAKFYYDSGFNILLTDQRSHGKSEGKYIGFGILERYDCQSWIEFVNKKYGNPDILLSGVSMGATTVLMAAGLGLPKNVKGIVADCGFTSPKEIITRVLNNDFKIAKFPVYYIASIFSKIFAGYSYNDYSTIEAVKSSDIPVIFFHGEADTFVPCNMSKRMYEASISPKKELFIVDGALHAESYAKDTTGYQKRLSAFINKVA